MTSIVHACLFGTVETVNAILVYGNYYHVTAETMNVGVENCCSSYCTNVDCSAKCEFIKGTVFFNPACLSFDFNYLTVTSQEN